MLIQMKIPMSMGRNKLPGQEVMQKHASFPGVGTHSVVRGRTRSPHRKQNRESGGVPTVSMEHMYMSDERNKIQHCERERITNSREQLQEDMRSLCTCVLQERKHLRVQSTRKPIIWNLGQKVATSQQL